MSFWINEMKCRKCGTPINVAGGMVQTTWMGPADKDLKCLNTACDGVGYSNFEMVNPKFPSFEELQKKCLQMISQSSPCKCGGNGSYPEHDDHCTGSKCSPFCPIQVQCECANEK